jgi:hypothetical protein
MSITKQKPKTIQLRTATLLLLGLVILAAVIVGLWAA